MVYLLYYILFINLIGVIVMYADKQKARKNEYRIPEKTLWLVAVLGGAIGTTIGMKWFRHKTKHASFKWGFPALAIIWLGLLLYLS
ncbi:DUF1294 domain-containing protein [Robertmurraya yapensis]|uniref:DUF1294 domain-containing protein n=1 Tax=Bacillus yapensis TaxID=2492960 RepID=A0A431W2J1_9BACI|nr:DUF1294 domain-containing protein [Bacillus yapensis]RTR29652.1 DUF1294 domain-containing protein [Bacillus yapensis]TKS94998.1 DUF1294 domain-containing protein [Bacillus yapensis]